MIPKYAKLYALTHFCTPIVLSIFYFALRQPILIVLTVLSFLWSIYLMWHAFIRQNLFQLLKNKNLWWFLFIDHAILALSFALPDWQDNHLPVWLILFYVPIYCHEIGAKSAFWYSILGIANIYLFHHLQTGQFFSLETLFIIIGMLGYVVSIGVGTDRLQKLAYMDNLTTLPNRVHLAKRLDHIIAEAERQQASFGLLLVDLDQFKYVNDTLGHWAGDELLKQASLRLKEQLNADYCISRMGGDEFVIVTPFIADEQEIADVCKKLLHTLNLPLFLEGKEMYITASIGISVFPEDGADLKNLLINADAAMYHAKDRGRNQYQFYSPVLKKHTDRIEKETMLRKGLDNEEFVVYFQPRIHAATEKISSMEALVRWEHPEKGIIPPSEFIPLAEDTGLILPIGEYVLEHACIRLKQWMKEGYAIQSVSVNLSPRQLMQSDFAIRVECILAQIGLDGKHLELEITENAAVQDLNTSIRVLHELKQLGIRISVDDFGTGHSTLNYLRTFPIDALKIDRSFISGVENNDQDAAIVYTMISLAKMMKLDVTAEGVETIGQLNFLKANHCKEIQGYYFAKPMSASEMEVWLRENAKLASKNMATSIESRYI